MNRLKDVKQLCRDVGVENNIVMIDIVSIDEFDDNICYFKEMFIRCIKPFREYLFNKNCEVGIYHAEKKPFKKEEVQERYDMYANKINLIETYQKKYGLIK
jgi:hypothetical protein